MTNELLPLSCPGCAGMMAEAHQGLARLKATSFESCLRRCEVCGIGASNTSDSQRITYIHRDPLTNIPEESRDGALDTLSAALNVCTRSSKRFGFSTSEDAVTWVVFSYLNADTAADESVAERAAGCIVPIFRALSKRKVTKLQSPRVGGCLTLRF
jgi:hypothetical protein